MVLDTILVSPIGKLGIQLEQQSLVAIHFLPAETKIVKPSSPLATDIVKQLEAYFSGQLCDFNIPITLANSAFSQQVLRHLTTIKPGTTQSYSEVARILATGPRAVGNACRRNPIPIILPCHRVVAIKGMGGYSGATSGYKLGMKKWLLVHEKNMIEAL